MALVVVLALALAAPADATYPGENGKLLFTGSGDCNLYTINPDGSDVRQFADTCYFEEPVWSPDGTKIAYGGDGDIHVINADGSGDFNVTGLPGGEWTPSWSPDGTRIAYERATIDPVTNRFERHVWTSRTDGTDHLQLDSSMCWTVDPIWHPAGTHIAVRGMATREPNGECTNGEARYLVNTDGTGHSELPVERVDSWSPDGSKASFFTPPCGGTRHPPCQIYVQPADGSAAPTPVGPSGGGKSDWSPDGTKLAFKRSDVFGGPAYLWIMNADGTGATQLTTFHVGQVDWQPIPVNGYSRPKGTEPNVLSLVPAYQACTTANRTHGPPLAFPSCNPPQREPGALTVGTPDANGRPAKSVSLIRLRQLVGNPQTPPDEADISLSGTINDVRLASDLSDYTGTLDARMTLRITDKDNTPHPGGPGAATVQDIAYSFPIPCAATADTTIGGDCTFDTTAEAFVPGIAKEGRRAIWELGQLRVHDGAGGVFMRQGIFIP